MTGSARDGGVMIRAIDVLFNSLQERLVFRKNMIFPDRLNDFQVMILNKRKPYPNVSCHAEFDMTQTKMMIENSQRSH